MSDLLAQYRKRPASVPAAGVTTPPDEPDAYCAFAAKDRVERLKIKLAKEATRAPGYNNLLEIVIFLGSIERVKRLAGIGQEAVQEHMRSIFAKLDTQNHTETAVKAIKLGLL